MMKFAALIGAALIFASPMEAEAADYADRQVGDWHISGGDEACQAFKIFAEYKTGKPVSLSLIYNAKSQNALLSFSNTVATSITDGQEVDIEIFLSLSERKFDDGWGTKTFTTRVMDGDRFFNSPVLHKEILTDFAKAEVLAFFYEGEVVSSFRMSGSATAIQELRRCAFMEAGLNPDDPFLK